MASPIYDQHHAVQFYDNEITRFQSAAAFLGQGLLDGQPAIVIATANHGAGILSHLQQRMIDVARARRLGDLVARRAQGTCVRAYGEMVDPLWQQVAARRQSAWNRSGM